MAKIIEFPGQAPAEPQLESYDYSGHLMLLDLRKATKFQCFNFFVGTHNKIAPVPEKTDQSRIHQAVQSGILIDITEHPELFIPEKSPIEVKEQETGKKFYSGTVQFFYDLGLTEDQGIPGEKVGYATDNPEVQRKIEDALRQEPVIQGPALSMEDAKSRQRRSLLELPPGFDHPERYLLS